MLIFLDLDLYEAGHVPRILNSIPLVHENPKLAVLSHLPILVSVKAVDLWSYSILPWNVKQSSRESVHRHRQTGLTDNLEYNLVFIGLLCLCLCISGGDGISIL